MPPVVAEPEERTIAVPQTRTGGPGGGGPHDSGPDDRGGGGGGDEPDEGSGYVPGLSLLGMSFMLVSIATLFLAVAMVYLARSRSPKFWQPVQVPHLLWFSTAIILASSSALERARRFVKIQHIKRYTRWLWFTVSLGIGFLCCQALALRELTLAGLFLSRNPHSSMFFVITGLHAVHLFAGLAMLLFLVLRVSLRPQISYKHFHRLAARNAVISLYWHGLDGIWLAMFAFLLLLR